MVKFNFCNIVKLVTIAFHKPYDTTIESNRSLERERRIALTTIVASIEKVISMAIPLITVRITFNYLGVEIYGLWNAVINFFALFAFSDLGLGNGLQTKLSQAYGKDDMLLCKQLISSTYFILCSVAFLLLVIFLIIYPFVNWGGVMNATNSQAQDLAASIVCVIVIPKILAIPLAIISRTQLALQEGYNYCIWAICGSITSLAYICTVAYLDLGKIILLGGSAIIPLVFSILNMIVYYGWQRIDLRFSLSCVKKVQSCELLNLGLSFCLLSILTNLGFSMDTFIVAKTCALEDAGVFAILSKVMYILSAVLTIFAQPLWGANGEAISRGDFAWVRKNTNKMSLMMTASTICLSLIVVIFSKLIFRLWLGEELNFSIYCLSWMCLFQICTAFISPWFMVLNASGQVKIQILTFSVFTPLCFVLKFILGNIYGVSAIPAVGSILYFLIITLSIYFISNRHLDKLENGINAA